MNARGEDRSDFQAGGRPWTSDDFGIVKLTESTDWKARSGPANAAVLKAEGKVRGFYHFFHPAVSAVSQASYFVSCARSIGIEPGDFFMADVEIAVGEDGRETAHDRVLRRMHVPLMQMSPQEPLAAVGSSARTFLDTVAQLVGPSHRVVIYSYLSFLPQLGACTGYPLNVADYSSRPPASVAPWSEWVMWQNSDTGGQGGGDTDIFNGSVAALRTWALGSTANATVTVDMPVLVLGAQDRPGANQAVGKMQALLNFVGTKNGIRAAQGLAEDGDFGPGTLAAVEAVQAFYKIPGGQGQCGERTWAHLFSA